MTTKPNMHFADNYLLQPTNPIVVNLIGAGGTGSQMLTALARMNHALTSLGHPGLMIHLYDDDIVTTANLGRQLFAPCDVGLNKASVLCSRINRFFGSAFKAIPLQYYIKNKKKLLHEGAANLIISCVDTVDARFQIAEILNEFTLINDGELFKPLYWMDAGNGRDSGQVILSTIGNIKQPHSNKFKTVNHLPFITEQFKELLQRSEDKNDTPSCSLAEALSKQDLFINSAIANMGASLLWNLLREGMTAYRGFYLNLKDYRTVPVAV